MAVAIGLQGTFVGKDESGNIGPSHVVQQVHPSFRVPAESEAHILFFSRSKINVSQFDF